MSTIAPERLSRLLRTEIERIRPTGGGSIASAYAVDLQDGRRVFVKDYGDAPHAIVRAEARGLDWLAEPGVIDVARVVALDPEAPVLVLDWIESGRRDPASDEALGRRLAALHQSRPPAFGHDHPGYIGPLPVDNTPAESWPAFYAERRLRPLLRRARDDGRIPASVARDADTVLERLASLCGPEEPPARLHGDLWSGNVMVDAGGTPVLVDPSPYGGCREMDLAMMRLFGGFSERTFDAYAEQAPLPDGAAERVPLCQLHPLLVHVVLFGGSYVGDFAAALARYR